MVSIIFRNKIIPFYVSILTLGESKAKHIGKAINSLKSLGLKIGQILLDRGFYSGEVIDGIQAEKIQYLIFVPKNPMIKKILANNKTQVYNHQIKYYKNFSKQSTNTTLVFIRNVYDYDWVFATNLTLKNVQDYIRIYKQRWHIETMFRVHDEAKIKTKSKIPVIRLFYFIWGMLILSLWTLFEKDNCCFKKLIYNLAKLFSELNIPASISWRI